MKENYDDKVEEKWPIKNCKLLVTSENDAGVDDRDIAKSITQMPSHLGSYIIGHSKRLFNIVIRERDGFYNDNIYYVDNDGAYIHKKHWSTLVEKGFSGKSLVISYDY